MHALVILGPTMAARLPMIATDVGGNSEAIIDGESRLIVPPRAPERLAQAIVRLASDPALRAEMGAAACRRVNEHFALEPCVKAYDALAYDALYRTHDASGPTSK
jgi:glycosyltransferase involved in cell wall biosynthesis